MDDIYETYISFGKMYVFLEDQVEKRDQASKSYDAIVYWKRYMKYKPENIIILSSFQLKKVKTILTAWLDLNEMVENTIKKAHAVCERRWYVFYGIMETLCFPTVDLIENSYPPRLMIEQVKLQQDESKEKIQGLDHITIEDVDQLIRQPLYIEGNIHIYIRIQHKLA